MRAAVVHFCSVSFLYFSQKEKKDIKKRKRIFFWNACTPRAQCTTLLSMWLCRNCIYTLFVPHLSPYVYAYSMYLLSCCSQSSRSFFSLFLFLNLLSCCSRCRTLVATMCAETPHESSSCAPVPVCVCVCLSERKRERERERERASKRERPWATSVWGLKPRVYKAFRY
jgi:hypothetical protein